MAMDSVLDERTLREIYITAFEIAIKEGKPKSLMTSYNMVNGVYANENEHLLMDILRKDIGFDGMVVTDWGASNDHALGVKNGSSLEMPAPGLDSARELLEALKTGKISENDIDARVDELIDITLSTKNKKKPDDKVKMFEDNKLLQSADFDIFKNLTKMNGGLMFRNSSVKKSKMNNITSIDEVHITLDTTDLFLSFNSLRKLPDTESSNAILDGYSSRIRMNNIEYIGENSIQDAEYIILGVDKIPELKENCSFKRVFVKNDMVSFFKEHSSRSKFNIHPISELVNLYPSHGDVWKKM